MLNISSHSVSEEVKKKKYDTLETVEKKISKKVLRRIITVMLILFIIILFIPWTQNIRSTGKVITLQPDQRPQTVNSIIAGRIEKWYVREGDIVQKGDTIAFISEVKDAYFDTDLIKRTEEQLALKEQAVVSYQQKIEALDNQFKAITDQRRLKLEQTRNKLMQSKLKAERDSIDYQASQLNFRNAYQQYKRMDSLYQEGLKSLTDLENRNLKQQEAKAKEVESLNKWLTSKNDVINAQIEIFSIDTKFESDLSKIQSDKFTATSNKFDAAGQVTKLRNQLRNYQVRNGMYYITAPQYGYVTKSIQNGLGETFKEGAPIVNIMPLDYELAVELYIEPLDLPLMSIGQEVRIQFDGWPAIIFTGWPEASYGTYGGKVYAIDQYIGTNGKYRVLVKPDPNDHPWPEALRYGGGTNNMIMLNDVPIWYELWRNINGFPPNFYQFSTPKNMDKTTDKKK